MRRKLVSLIYICLGLNLASTLSAAEVVVSVRAGMGGNATELADNTKPDTQNLAKDFVSDLEGDLMGLLFDEGYIAFNTPAVISDTSLRVLSAPDVLSLARSSNADLMILCELQLGGGQAGKNLNGISGRVSIVRMDGKELSLKNTDLSNLASLALSDLIARIRSSASALLGAR